MSLHIGVCIGLLVHELTKLYTVVKNKERENAFNKMMTTDPEYSKIDKDFIISEQRRIIDQLKISNSYHEKIAVHYKKLYFWR